MASILLQKNDLSDAHLATYETFKVPDPRSIGVYHVLQDIYKAFAEKIFQENTFMRQLLMSGLNPMDILKYPICGKCETLAMWSGRKPVNGRVVRQCTCTAVGCGKTTDNPITLNEWISYELKRKASPQDMEIIRTGKDAVAETMVRIAQKNLDSEIAKQDASMGIELPDGTIHQVSGPPEETVIYHKVSNVHDLSQEQMLQIIESEEQQNG